MSDMIERVARAICRADRYNVDEPWTTYAEHARAAIEAMREPTEAMRECGRGAGWSGAFQGLHDDEEAAAGDLWRTMIDAALVTGTAKP